MTGKCGMVFGGIYRFHRRAFRSFKLSGFLPLFLGQKNWLHTFDGKLNDGRTQKTTGTTEKKRRRQVRGWNCLVAGGVDLKWCSSFVFCFFLKKRLKKSRFWKTRWWFKKTICLFTPITLEMIQFDEQIFSKGLVQPCSREVEAHGIQSSFPKDRFLPWILRMRWMKTQGVIHWFF